MKLNDIGITPNKGLGHGTLLRAFGQGKAQRHREHIDEHNIPRPRLPENEFQDEPKVVGENSHIASPKRLTVLIATMEYDIEDWGIKVKIGGLGVMSSLMGKNLKHQDLIWVIPW